jgi:drug/metabolite transporter (DMT)-like permease
VLGALNGLLCGTAFGLLNEVYIRSLPQPASDDVVAGNAIILMRPRIQPNIGFIMLLCALLFALVSYGAHRLWRGRALSLLVLWQIVGALSFALLCTAASLEGHDSYYASLPRGTSLIGLAVVVIISFIFGVVAESSAKLYSQD